MCDTVQSIWHVEIWIKTANMDKPAKKNRLSQAYARV